MASIPNTLHFIWLSQSLPCVPQARRLARWVYENPHYTFMLWGEPTYLLANLQVVTDELLKLFAPGRVEQMKFEQDPNGYRLLIDLQDFSDLRVYSRPIGLLPPLPGATANYLEDLHSQDDIISLMDYVRICALYHWGGISIDFCAEPVSQPLRPYIPAPRDILFELECPAAAVPTYTNSVIAAPSHAEPLLNIFRTMVEHFSKSQLVEQRTVFEFSEFGRKRTSRFLPVKIIDLYSGIPPEEKQNIYWNIIVRKIVLLNNPTLTDPFSTDPVEVFPESWEYPLYSFQIQSGYPLKTEVSPRPARIPPAGISTTLGSLDSSPSRAASQNWSISLYGTSNGHE